LLIVSVFLFKLGRRTVYTLVPMVLMLVMSIWAMAISFVYFWNDQKWSLLGVSVVVLLMSLWLIVEGLLAFARGRGELALDDEMPSGLAAEEAKALDSAHIG